MSKQIKYLIIHCADTPATMEVTGKHIRQWHLSPKPRGRGWRQVGYRGLFHLDGTYEKLIDYKTDGIINSWEITNGVRGFNGVSAHICYAGGKGGDTRTKAQKERMERYIKAFLYMQPWVKVGGHYHLDNSKPCPNFDVERWLKEIGINENNILRKP